MIRRCDGACLTYSTHAHVRTPAVTQEGNALESFVGFTAQPRLQALYMAGNEVAKHKHYRLMALLVGGKQLKVKAVGFRT